MIKTCMMCGKDSDEIAVLQVVAATWNGFNNFAEVCPPCQESRKFKMWQKALNSGAAKAARSAALTAVTATPGVPLRSVEVLIAHRQTGAVLHTVASGTLNGAQLGAAALSGAALRGVSLRGADLLKADLHLADLAGADLRGADLRAVNFRGADLRGADLREARLSQADLHFSIYDNWTRWPTGFDPRASGAEWGARRG